ncbi:hypothetical protein AJ80_00600 [Polytolypa hystricis UAMH7299]|uniref:DUF8035 domain-containing protein n=1 Tax=Polytolypa hystricis (strain UAMH7299) TaxID=1447883 RepID=A0A2B7Z423_POLH7|nr:hypothetical protein AJ80_00600 [Polytolypa hystricis UAMH7299]
MSYPRYRASSPEGRRFVDPMRASTGNMTAGAEVDPYHHPSGRFGYEGYPSSRVPSDRSYDPYQRNQYPARRSPRPSDEYALEAQPISKTYRTGDQASTSRTEYAVRPRSNTVADSNRRPLSVIIPRSPNRPHASLAAPHDPRSARPTSYYMDDTGRYILPASSPRHRRIVSSDEREGRLGSGDKEGKARIDRGGYLSTGSGIRKSYVVSGSGAKPQDVDVYDSYSYTTPKEQFYRDSNARQDHWRDTYRRRERPLSMTGLERYLPQLPRDPRDMGPPPSSRGFSKLGEEIRRPSPRNSEGSEALRASDTSHTRSDPRAPVSLHQERDGPSSYRDQLDDPRDMLRYRRRYEENREDRPHSSSRDERRFTPSPRGDNDRKGGSRDLYNVGIGTLASGYVPDMRGADYEASPNPRHEKPRSRYRDVNQPSDKYRPPRAESVTDDGGTDEEARKHRHRNTESRKKDRAEPSSEARGDRHSRDSDRENSDAAKHSPSQGKILPYDRPTVASPVDVPDDRRWKPTTDTKPSNQLEVQPKGILKTPTQKFPEDHRAVREGVAPLKDTSKQGIPAGARWTKVDRRLVSPSALEGHERYEVREDYVIVLRVLTKEEIQAYAMKTAEIRGAAYDSSRRDRHRRRQKDSDNESDSGEDDHPATQVPSDSKRYPPSESHPEQIKRWLQGS